MTSPVTDYSGFDTRGEFGENGIRDGFRLPPKGADSYRMITAFTASNFKSFKSLKLEKLSRVNIIVGQSAAGKTALLEALRLALGGSPQVAYMLNVMRGTQTSFNVPPTREQFEAVWSAFFRNFDLTKVIDLSMIDSSKHNSSLRVYFDQSRAFTPSSQQNVLFPQQQLISGSIAPILFERTLFDGTKNILMGTVNSQGSIHFDQGEEIGSATDFFPSTWQSNAMQVANWFSQLSIENQEIDVIDTVRDQFPQIKDLSVQSPFQFPSLHATISSIPRKIPISLVSSGINKFISLLVSIKNYRRGVVLIDEIENGIYYKIFPQFWSSLHSFSRKSETQLFVSTHSLECLNGASLIIDKNPADFTLIQMHQDEHGSSAYVVQGENAAAAIEAGVEVRR